MTWTGLLLAAPFYIYIALIVYLIWERRKIYQLNTKVFFLIYVAYLGFRASTLLYVTDTTMAAFMGIVSILIFYPIAKMTIQVMRIGDPWKIAHIVSDLREQLKEKDRLEKEKLMQDPIEAERSRLKQEVTKANDDIDRLTHRLTDVLRMTRQ